MFLTLHVGELRLENVDRLQGTIYMCVYGAGSESSLDRIYKISTFLKIIKCWSSFNGVCATVKVSFEPDMV